VRRYLGLTHERIGTVREATGDFTGAEASFRASLGIREAMAESNPGSAEFRRDLAVAHENLGHVRAAQGSYEAARYSYETSLAMFKDLSDADPANVNATRSLSVSYEKLGDLSRETRRFDEARDFYTRSLRLREALHARQPSNVEAQSDLARSYGRFGQLHEALAERTGSGANARGASARAAREWYQKSLAAWQAARKTGSRPEIVEAIQTVEQRLQVLGVDSRH
jgi:tetratricopeptide (TPR) repeat protein